MIRKSNFVLVSLSLLITLNVALVMAQVRIAGVSAGNWFTHGEISVNWSSNDTGATFPPYGWEWLEEWNQTESMSISVVDVSDVNITADTTEYFKNGTEKVRSGWIDIESGNSSKLTNETMDMTFMFISADLNTSDSIYASGEYSTWKINETAIRIYQDGARETSHLNLTWEYSYALNETEYYYYYSMNYYWDRPTGALVEWYLEEINQTGQYLTTWSALSKITESDVWVVPEFPFETVLLGLIMLTTISIIYKRRLRI